MLKHTHSVLIATVDLLECVIHSMAVLICNGLVQQLPVLIIHIHVHLTYASPDHLMLAVRQSRQFVHNEPVCQSYTTAQQHASLL